MSGHAFLAVDLTDIERHDLAAALSEANPGGQTPGRRPPVGNWHITLRFIGECTDMEADQLVHEVANDLSESQGRVFVYGLGAFPRASKASVLYASIDDHEGLVARLAGVCEAGAREVGFDPEERPFVPHITLSRLRPPKDVRKLIEAFAPLRVPIRVSAITLFRSIPSRSGITYHPLDTIELS